ncbi:MAG TPA: PEGA domain-containing protein, partial [Bryobacteraceae bacterium]
TSTETKPAPGSTKAPATNASVAPVPTRPTVRLYTDLVPGSVSTDNKPAEPLKDGELVLDNVEPGHHSMKVTGRSGEAEFSYDVTEKAAPKVVGLPAASNVMAVLVSTEDQKARLVSNVDHLQVALDGKPAGTADSDGLTLNNLGTSDHDLQVSEGNDHQRFVLTYTPAPALTVYVKSDPSAGTVVVVTGQDGAEVYINNVHYRRQTEHGQIRIPNLKVGQYTIRVHKAGFLDPPPAIVHVKKGEETRAEFKLQPVPQIATLEIKGALPGTMVYVDGDLAAAIEGGGAATISNVKPGNHAIELRRDGAPTKKLERTFNNGDVVLLSGPEVVLNKATVESQPNTPASPSSGAAAEQPNPEASAPGASAGMQLQGEQVRKGGGFVPYHTPRVAGHYTFAAMNRKGGFLKHGKIQWYAGFQNGENYVLFILDGKRATIRRVINDKSEDVSRVSFSFDSDEWVQVDLSVKPNSISARVRHPDGPWVEMGDVVSTAGADFTKDRVGFYIPGSDELAVSNFRFSPR